MADTLYSIIQFTGIAIGDTQTVAHTLSCNGVPLVPDRVDLQFSNVFEFVSATTTTLTIRNTADPVGDCLAWCHAIHPIERSFGLSPDDGTFGQHMTPQPFVPGSPNPAPGSDGRFEIVVYQPGGVSAQNVFATWPEVLTALASLQGQRILQFDASVVSPAPIPVGGPYDMSGVIWASAPNTLTDVEIPEGATFTQLRTFTDRIQVSFTGTTPPIADFGAAPPNIDLLTIDNGANVIAQGAGPMFDIGASAQINLGNQAGLLHGTHAVVNLSGGTTSLFVQGADSILPSGAISGSVGTTLALSLATSAPFVFVETQPAFLGTLNLTNASRTFNFPTAVLTGNTVLTSVATAQMVLVNPTGGAFAVTLPAAAGLRGQTILFKNTTASANNVTIAAAGGDNIDGSATAVLAAARFAFRVTSDGVNTWYITT